ncbi:hypothetical protein BDR26DRAFT_1005825 [Obelidium mucronatum]|nr:hypothetical protein BDR26DRAFT_1005825 [Obelidium mucronatum]
MRDKDQPGSDASATNNNSSNNNNNNSNSNSSNAARKKAGGATTATATATAAALLYGVPGYVCTEVVYASSARAVDVVIQRGYSLADARVKVICKGAGVLDEAANRRIEHEYETLRFLYAKAAAAVRVSEAAPPGASGASSSSNHNHSFIPRPIEIVKDRGIWTLVVEDVGGCSLRKFQDLFRQPPSTAMSVSASSPSSSLRKLPLETILHIAIQIVEALKLTITAGVIHKDINPDNIVVVPLPNDQLAVQLIDFNLASITVTNDSSTNDSNILQGTMAYMAPEQTGRLQRNTDFRSDFYSLGVTLWEIVVGRPAFHFNDVMEYMHAHIAIEIEPPAKVDPTVPETLSEIIQKLVKKSPEARYQSIYGLKYDLMACLKTIMRFKKAQRIPADQILTDQDVLKAFMMPLSDDGDGGGVVTMEKFEIGTKDCSKTVHIPKGKLYGRNSEQEMLLGHVERILENSSGDLTNFILVVGERGMGNNSLLGVARAKVVASGNFCITGAYTEGCLPLQGLVQALQQFIGILLSSQTEILESYVAKLKQNLGVEISRLETVIPDLRLLFTTNYSIYTEDKVHKATYPEMVADVTKIFKVIAGCDKAIVLCLKDIESADEESFTVLACLANFSSRFLVILTSSEPETISPLVANSLQNVLDIHSKNFHLFTLKPLTIFDIQELLEDTVTPSLAPLHNLAALIERKTFGTPAYVHQFLLKAEAKGLLWFDEDEVECGWNWDIATLDKNIDVSESVLKDMTKRINALSKESKDVLEKAVCIGANFDVRLLSLLLNQKTAVTTNMLWDFLKAGFIKPVPFLESKGPWKDVVLDGFAANPEGAVIEYKFAFDVVYKEIYESLGELTLGVNHLKIARILHSIATSKGLVGQEIVICKHYNLARPVSLGAEENHLIATLNLIAAEQAMSICDFDNAKEMLTHGTKIVAVQTSNDPWSGSSASLYFNLNLLLAKCLIVDGELEEAKSLLRMMERHSKSNKSHIYKVFYLQRHLDAMFGDFNAVLTEGLSNLKELGIQIPTTGQECEQMALGLRSKCQSLIDELGVAKLLAVGKHANEECDMIQAIVLIVSFAASRISCKFFFSCLIAIGCHRSLTDGFGRSSSALWTAYPCLHFYLSGGNRFSAIKVSQQMADGINAIFVDKSAEFEVIYKTSCGHSIHLSIHQKIEMMEALIQNARHSGHNLSMNFLSPLLIVMGMMSGRSASWLKTTITNQREILELSQSQSIPTIDLLSDMVDAFMSGEAPQPRGQLLCQVLAVFQALVYEKPEMRSLHAQLHEGDRCVPIDKTADFFFVEAMAHVLDYDATPGEKEKQGIEAKLVQLLATLESHTQHGFKDTLGKKDLVLAEYARIKGKTVDAIKLYESAIETFKSEGSVLFEAFTLEKFAMFWHNSGMKKMAKMCFIESANKWGEYGSNGKRVQVASKFKILYGAADFAEMEAASTFHRTSPTRQLVLDPSLGNRKGGTYSPSGSSSISRSVCQSSRFGDSQTTNGTVSLDVDATTALKVAQSIREEISLDALLRKIMKYVMVNTGATKGALVLNDSSRLMIEAIAEFNDNKEVIEVLQSHPVTAQVPGFRLPLSVIYYTFRTRKSIVLTEPSNDPTHGGDAYIKEFMPQSILCCPIINQSSVTGVVYLENKLQGAAFTPKRIEIIQSLMPTASVYIKNAKLTKTNVELTEALKDSGNASNAPKYKIDAPVQRAIDILQSLKGRMVAQGDPAVRQIDFIMMSLTSSDLFMSSIDEINDENGRGIDQDTKNWIENSLLQKASKPSKGSEVDGDAMFVVGNRRPTIVSALDEGGFSSMLPSSGSPHLSPKFSIQNQEEINVFLESSMDFEFDVFRLGELTNGQPLYYLSMHLLQYYGLIEHFNIDIDVAKTFFREVESNYRDLSYHNSYHAADVLQTVNLLLLSDPQMAQNFTKLEILAACIASAVHDVDHPGVNNNYLIQSSHPLAILYNDLSVLEYHHASKAFEIMQKPGMNIFAHFPNDQKRDIRKQMINMVIATDMSQHFTYINKLKSKISASALKLQEAPDRALVLDMAIKCADLNNPAKSLESCKLWAFRIMEEFFQQGDRERLNGLNVSMFMDRKETNIPKCQVGFVDILVTPLFEAWSQCIATDFTRLCMKNISLNRAYWESILDKPDAIPTFNPPDSQVLEQELFATVGSPATLKKKLISMQKSGSETSDSIKQRTKSNGTTQKPKVAPSPPTASKISSGPISKNFQKPALRPEPTPVKPTSSTTTSTTSTTTTATTTAQTKGETLEGSNRGTLSFKQDGKQVPVTPRMGRRTSGVVDMINPVKASPNARNLPELPKHDSSGGV